MALQDDGGGERFLGAADGKRGFGLASARTKPRGRAITSWSFGIWSGKVAWREKWRYIKYLALKQAIFLLKPLPFGLRRALGAGMVRVLGPMSKRKSAIMRKNLARAFPELSDADRDRIARDVWGAIGAFNVELYSPRDLQRQLPQTQISGPGLDVMRQAYAEGRATLVVTGHFGQWEVIRLHLTKLGIPCGGMYKEHSNRFYSQFFADALRVYGTPIVPRGASGTRELLRALRQGHPMAMLLDQPSPDAVLLPFFGRPARTAIAPAEIALKLDIPMIPVFAVRKPGGRGYDAVFEAPLARGAPEEMMTEFNARLEAQVRAHPGQWLWVYNRWK